ncbi:MAG TPA: hypothetical protein DCZ95_16785 [Verrucomicrobia bacterium]|nr:MAG: hypothetical protein A2X46_14680 [Lentisphaerae bacterium GWF2_57_35]HBA85740.1 hypothetical protein [Verrucomicrobiota bacterium]
MIELGTIKRAVAVGLWGWAMWVGACAAETNRPDLWFPVGERLVYKVYWGFIPVGYVVTTSEWIEEDGRTLLAIRIKTKSNAVIEKLYPVEDYLETIVDPVSFLPVRFTKKLSEGRYTAHQQTTFDHKNLTAHWEALDEDDDREETFPIEADTRDLISLMYKIREDGFDQDTELNYRVMADEKMYDMIIQPGREEKVALSLYGKVDAIKIEPQGKFQGLFIRKGRMWVWVTKDKRCLIAKVAARVPVASVNIVLLDVSGPGDDSWIAGKQGEIEDAEALFIEKSKQDKEQDKK